MKDRNSQNSTKTDKPSLGYRVGRGLRSAGAFGRDAVRQPREIPQQAHGALRRWFAKVWEVRGGGLYAVGYAVTFLWFEIKSTVADIAESNGPVAFFSSNVFGNIVSVIIEFALDTLFNMIKAFMWPVYVVQFQPPWGPILLGVAFIVFDKFLRKPVERWLAGDQLQPGD